MHNWYHAVMPGSLYQRLWTSRSRPYRTLLAVTSLTYALGVIWRADFIFLTHPFAHYLYSDMLSYANEMFRFIKLRNLDIGDAIYPPGTSLFFGLFYRHGLGWNGVEGAQFLISAAAPLLIGAIGWRLYDSRVGLLAVALSSLYVGFIGYAGFLLSENPFLFFMLLSMLVLILALQATSPWRSLWRGVGAGVIFGAAASMRSVVLLPGLLTAGVLLLPVARRTWRSTGSVVLGAGIGAALVVVALSGLCTDLNEGRLCVISTNGAMGVLQGHYGAVGHFRFEDRTRGYVYEFGNPATLQEGSERRATFSFGPYDSAQVLAAAGKWVGAHPAEAVWLSIRHVGDLFYGSVPWPQSNTSDRGAIMLSEWYFRILILLPAVAYLLTLAMRKLKSSSRETAAALLLTAPMVGLMAVVFVTVAEPRYRIPFDAFTIILASWAYVRLWGSLKKHR